MGEIDTCGLIIIAMYVLLASVGVPPYGRPWNGVRTHQRESRHAHRHTSAIGYATAAVVASC